MVNILSYAVRYDRDPKNRQPVAHSCSTSCIVVINQCCLSVKDWLLVGPGGI